MPPSAAAGTRPACAGKSCSVEELNKKRMLVEDIQDIIEEKLMEIEKYELAKKYIVCLLYTSRCV